MDKEELIDSIMERLVSSAICTSCECPTCHQPMNGKATRDCFNKHPGWVNISPHSIERVLREKLKALY